ncbi:unnamed protein product, partial [Urochloa humidicola]
AACLRGYEKNERFWRDRLARCKACALSTHSFGSARASAPGNEGRAWIPDFLAYLHREKRMNE